ncbi:MAG TPA: hypothetical protein VIM30_16015, partial [Candidatus Limnocylindrales bacterium]
MPFVLLLAIALAVLGLAVVAVLALRAARARRGNPTAAQSAEGLARVYARLDKPNVAGLFQRFAQPRSKPAIPVEEVEPEEVAYRIGVPGATVRLRIPASFERTEAPAPVRRSARRGLMYRDTSLALVVVCLFVLGAGILLPRGQNGPEVSLPPAAFNQPSDLSPLDTPETAFASPTEGPTDAPTDTPTVGPTAPPTAPPKPPDERTNPNPTPAPVTGGGGGGGTSPTSTPTPKPTPTPSPGATPTPTPA